MASGTATSGGGKKQVNPWLIAFTVSLATFMEVMDTSIANVALRHIAGSLAASQDESTWVLTSYLMSNAIIVPMSGWLSSYLGRKRFYMICVGLFTISSLLCGMAPTLGLLLLFRVIQGIGGGGLAPSEQAILADTFPASQRGMAFAMYGVAVVVAPAIGPALGGWITDTYSWRWIFFINIPVGILSLVMTGMLVQESPDAKRAHREATSGKRRVDFMGFFLVALGLGCLQVVLDKGQEDDWFGSHMITTFAILAVVGIIGMIIWEMFVAKDPVVDLKLFRNRSFFFSCVMMFAVLFVLQSTTQMLPQFVQQISSYDATKAGLVLMPGGFALMALMPLVGFLVKKIQPKYLIMFGFVLSGLALLYLAHFTTDVSFGTVALGRVAQSAGLAFLFIPINVLAFYKLPPGKSNNASALTNVMRNLGGSVGISVGATLLARRSQVHQAYLTRALTPSNLQFQGRLEEIGRHLGQPPGTGQPNRHALAAFMQGLQQQAAMLSYIDVFQVLIIGCIIAMLLAWFLRRINLNDTSPGH